MLQPLAPGVHFREVAGGPRPIAAVGTSTAGFVGVAPDATARVNQAVAVSGFRDFVRVFAQDVQTSTPLARAVAGFFVNGGRRCYVVNLGEEHVSLAGGAGEPQGLDVLAQVDEVAIVAAPGYTSMADYEALLGHCEQLQDRVAILDAPPRVRRLDQLLEVGRPAQSTSDASSGSASSDADRAPEDNGAQGVRPRQSDRGFGSYYFPWLVVRDPFQPESLVEAPPSGAMAGVYARTDATRGVHKAPANETLRGALELTRHVTRSEQVKLNEGGVNCIRSFSRQGIRIWGARTLAPAASEWRYVPVRRLLNMIEESIAENTQWVVFEPNDQALWKCIRRDVGAFLTRLWRDGALMGSSPEQAFRVKCDAETNTPEVIDSGRVVTEIGVAPVKPAEFIIFEIGQTTALSTEQEVNHG